MEYNASFRLAKLLLCPLLCEHLDNNFGSRTRNAIWVGPSLNSYFSKTIHATKILAYQVHTQCCICLGSCCLGLKTRVIIKISTHPCQPINIDQFSFDNIRQLLSDAISHLTPFPIVCIAISGRQVTKDFPVVSIGTSHNSGQQNIFLQLVWYLKKTGTTTHFNTRQHLIFWFEIFVPEQGQASESTFTKCRLCSSTRELLIDQTQSCMCCRRSVLFAVRVKNCKTVPPLICSEYAMHEERAKELSWL